MSRAHNQSVAGGRSAPFAPSLRCRRADARPRTRAPRRNTTSRTWPRAPRRGRAGLVALPAVSGVGRSSWPTRTSPGLSSKDDRATSRSTRCGTTRWRRPRVDRVDLIDRGRTSGAAAGLAPRRRRARRRGVARGRRAAMRQVGQRDQYDEKRTLSLTFGRRVSRLEFRRVRARWFAKRTRRDPPDVPPARPVRRASRRRPWREAAAVQLYGGRTRRSGRRASAGLARRGAYGNRRVLRGRRCCWKRPKRRPKRPVESWRCGTRPGRAHERPGAARARRAAPLRFRAPRSREAKPPRAGPRSSSSTTAH